MESIRNGILTVILVTELIKYWIGISSFGNVKIERKWIGIPAILCFCILVKGMGLELVDQHLLMYAIVYLVLTVTVKAGVKEKIKVLCMSITLIVCLDEILGIVVDNLLMPNQEGVLSESISIFLASILSLCIVSVFALVKKRTNVFGSTKFQIFVKNGIGWVMITLIIYLMFIIVGVNYISNYVENEKFSIFVDLVSITSLICMFVVTGFIFYIKEMNQKLNEMVQAEHKLREMQLEQYKVILERERDTRKYRHDMKNHFQCLVELAKSEKLEAVTEYIEDLEDELLEIGNRVYEVGNETLNAILNYHLLKLDYHTVIEVNGKCTRELQISNVDLCTIFANLIQNAVEELEDTFTNNGYIRIKMKTGQEFFEFEIVNSISGGSNWKDHENHGFGLGNVRRAVEKQHGFFTASAEEKEFVAKVILKV